MLPDFIIPGASRSGTTTLLNLLCHQRDFCLPPRELHFFSFKENYEKGLKWYASQFANCSEDQLIGEKSPSYFYELPGNGFAADRIKRDLQDVKLIFTLRNPVDRAYSQYCKNLSEGYFHESFKNLVEREKNKEITPETDFRQCFLHRNDYSFHLDRWLENFPRDQCLFLIFEEWVNEPEETLQLIYDFFGLDDKYLSVPDQLPERNTGWFPRSKYLNHLIHRPFLNKTGTTSSFLYKFVHRACYYWLLCPDKPDLSSAFRRSLLKYFKDSIHELETLIDKDLSIWLDSVD